MYSYKTSSWWVKHAKYGQNSSICQLYLVIMGHYYTGNRLTEIWNSWIFEMGFIKGVGWGMLRKIWNAHRNARPKLFSHDLYCHFLPYCRPILGVPTSSGGYIFACVSYPHKSGQQSNYTYISPPGFMQKVKLIQVVKNLGYQLMPWWCLYSVENERDTLDGIISFRSCPCGFTHRKV